MVVICSYCDKQFTLKKNLYAHLRHIHEVKPVLTQKKQLLCPVSECQELLSTYKDLRKHLKNKHEVESDIQVFEFSSKKDFVEWKEEMEKASKTLYIKNTGVKRNKKTYYYCHRSLCNNGVNKVLSEKFHRKRQIKKQGISKLNVSCPSTMEVTEDLDNNIKVLLYLPHLGHIIGILRHINLTKTERICIAGKIAEGVTFSRILDDIRDDMDPNHIKRINLLDRQDLRNIKKEFSLDAHIQFHKDDASSVFIWIEMMKKMGEDSPVLFYKAQNWEDPTHIFENEDFALIIMSSFQVSIMKQFGSDKICVDSTHGTNSYDFLLTTIVVVDEYGNGIPVAFLLSNKTDTSTLTHFFNTVKNKVGVVQTKTFMSDDAPEFFNAWSVAMAKPEHHLLCTWHVDRNWRKNLCKIGGDQELKAKIYKHIRVLLQTLDENEFDELLNFIMNELLSSTDTKEFGEYFQKYYAKRPELWAYCFRKGLGINTNMYMESMHKTLKYIYLEGKKNKRVDKCINALMKLVRDKMFQRIKKTVKGANSYRSNMINLSHKKNCEIKPEDITEEGNNCWLIKSSSSEYVYAVQRLSCDHNTCELFCKECKVCVHEYSCTCPDYSIKFNICKHIHALCQKCFQSKYTNKDVNLDDNTKLSSFLPEQNIQQISSKSATDRIRAKLDTLYAVISEKNISKDVALEMEKWLDKAIGATSDVKSLNKNKEPTNKNIEKQTRFISTKKKKSAPIDSLKKPSNEENAVIKNICLNVNNIDHNYFKSTGLFQ